MPNLTNKEVKETLKKFENRHTPRFKTFQLHGNKIEEVAKCSKKVWEMIFDIKIKDTKEKEKETIEIINEEDMLPNN